MEFDVEKQYCKSEAWIYRISSWIMNPLVYKDVLV